MKRRKRSLLLAAVLGLASTAIFGQSPSFHVLAFYTTHAERDHVDFALQAIPFFQAMAKRDNFEFRATSDWNEMNAAVLKQYQVVLWLNESPSASSQRAVFQDYMEHGGAWMGFHGAGWIDRRQTWPWFADFMGTLTLLQQ